MTFNVIATGSTGNAVLIDDHILIDCGIPWKQLKPHIGKVKLVLLTHQHSDHFRSATVAALAKERPTVRWGCCRWMLPLVVEAGVNRRKIDVMEPGESKIYNSLGTITPERLVHNVPNCGYHIYLKKSQEDKQEKLFYATDTGTLRGVLAPNYDLYLVEANHELEEIKARIEMKRANGEYAYEMQAARNHLSREQAEDWLYSQMGPLSEYAFLHQHKEVDTNHAE